MGTSYDKFIRTTDAEHEQAVQGIFKRLYEQGDIYKGSYEGRYCTPCESFLQSPSRRNCPDCGRPVQRPVKKILFKLSKYADRLINILKKSDFIQPESRKNEMVNNFLKPVTRFKSMYSLTEIPVT